MSSSSSRLSSYSKLHSLEIKVVNIWEAGVLHFIGEDDGGKRMKFTVFVQPSLLIRAKELEVDRPVLTRDQSIPAPVEIDSSVVANWNQTFGDNKIKKAFIVYKRMLVGFTDEEAFPCIELRFTSLKNRSLFVDKNSNKTFYRANMTLQQELNARIINVKIGEYKVHKEGFAIGRRIRIHCRTDNSKYTDHFKIPCYTVSEDRIWYIRDEDPLLKVLNLRIAQVNHNSFDDIPPHTFCAQSSVEDPIRMICFSIHELNSDQKVRTEVLKDVLEDDLLISFCKMVKKEKPDIITWYGDRWNDLEIIVKRIQILFEEDETKNMLRIFPDQSQYLFVGRSLNLASLRTPGVDFIDLKTITISKVQLNTYNLMDLPQSTFFKEEDRIKVDDRLQSRSIFNRLYSSNKGYEVMERLLRLEMYWLRRILYRSNLPFIFFLARFYGTSITLCGTELQSFRLMPMFNVCVYNCIMNMEDRFKPPVTKHPLDCPEKEEFLTQHPNVWRIQRISEETKKKRDVLVNRLEVISDCEMKQLEQEIDELKKLDFGVSPPIPLIEGGLVKWPAMGLHKWVSVHDFKSLYPSVMVSYCICLSNILIHQEYMEKAQARPHYWYQITDHSCVLVVLNPDAPVVKISKCILDERAKEKKLMKKAKIDGRKEDEAKYNDAQMTMKLTGNSLYGALSADNMLKYRAIQLLITGISRQAQLKMAYYCAEKGLDIIYGDTDSIFVKFPELQGECPIAWCQQIDKVCQFSTPERPFSFQCVQNWLEKINQGLTRRGKNELKLDTIDKKKRAVLLVANLRLEPILTNIFRKTPFEKKHSIVANEFEDLLPVLKLFKKKGYVGLKMDLETLNTKGMKITGLAIGSKKRENSVWVKELIEKLIKLVMGNMYEEAYQFIDRELDRLLQDKVPYRKLQCSYFVQNAEMNQYDKQINLHAAAMVNKYYKTKVDHSRIPVIFVHRPTSKCEKAFPVDVLVDKVAKYKIDYRHYLKQAEQKISEAIRYQEIDIGKSLNFFTQMMNRKYARANELLLS